MKKEKPLYGAIAYFGGWSVTFKPAGSSCHTTLSGYGDFPRTEYPGLPVVDFRTLDGPGLPEKKFPNLPPVREAYTHHIGGPDRYIPLADYLQMCEANGIIVFRA